jgi:hypothetical protein
MACAMPVLIASLLAGLSGAWCRDPLSSSAAVDRAGLATIEHEEAPN